MTKPERAYLASDLNRIIVGQRAIVGNPGIDGIDHGYAWLTTEVLWYDSDTGVFETKNNRYVPVALPDSSVVQ